MNLQIAKRSGERKGEVNHLRRDGYIPAVIYIRGKAADSVAINSGEFNALLRQVQPGRLATQKFTLIDEKGKKRQAILKEIQYHVTTYNVIHLDFEELHDNQPVKVKVPIECTGITECVGIKAGGVHRQVLRHIKVRCLPQDIPQAFYLDIRSLGPRESKRLSDLEIPETVRPIANMNEVAVVIVKR